MEYRHLVMMVLYTVSCDLSCQSSSARVIVITMTSNLPRDVHPLLQFFRSYLLGRKYKTNLRFEPDLAPRPGPPPILPEASYIKISANKYHGRDVRRLAAPPNVVPTKLSAKTATQSGLPVPGKSFNWTDVTDK